MTPEDKFIEGDCTVANWIAMLQDLPPEAVLSFTTGPGDWRALSPPYLSDDGKVVWVDLEETL